MLVGLSAEGGRPRWNVTAVASAWISRQGAGFEKRTREAGRQFHLLDWATVLPARPLPDPPAFRRRLSEAISTARLNFEQAEDEAIPYLR